MTMDKTNILHVIHDLGFGGAQRLLTDLVLHVDTERYSPSVAVLYSPQAAPYEEELRKRNIPVTFLGKHTGLDIGAVVRLGAVLRETHADIVHTHCHALRYVIPYVLARRVRAAVHTVHNLAAQDAGRPLWLTALAYKAGVVPVAIGTEVAASLGHVFGVANAPLIRNGIDVPRFAAPSTPREAVRSALGLGQELTFICAASLTPKKGHPILLDAFARVLQKVPDAKLLLAGTGVMRQSMEAQVARLGMGTSVRFLGTRTDMPDLLAAADVFVLASLWEGMPLAVMEAMAAGKPVVCTAVGGSVEIVQDGVNGLLVPSGYSVLLANAMTAMADPEKRAQFGKRGAEMAAGQFGLETMVRAYEGLYADLLSRRKL
jgi:glycosyltransferase involved in cell wall biosynthesis